MPIQAYVANPQVTALAPSLTVANRGNVRDNELDYPSGLTLVLWFLPGPQAELQAEEGTE